MPSNVSKLLWMTTLKQNFQEFSLLQAYLQRNFVFLSVDVSKPTNRILVFCFFSSSVSQRWVSVILWSNYHNLSFFGLHPQRIFQIIIHLCLISRNDLNFFNVGISRDSVHKRRSTGAKQKTWRKKRQFNVGRPPALTKMGAKRIHPVRVRGGHIKFRAIRLDTGNFSWGSEGKNLIFA